MTHSDGKESACNAGDPSSVPGPGRFPGAGNCYPLQHSWLENSMDRGVGSLWSWGCRVRHDGATSTFTFSLLHREELCLLLFWEIQGDGESHFGVWGQGLAMQRKHVHLFLKQDFGTESMTFVSMLWFKHSTIKNTSQSLSKGSQKGLQSVTFFRKIFLFFWRSKSRGAFEDTKYCFLIMAAAWSKRSFWITELNFQLKKNPY